MRITYKGDYALKAVLGLALNYEKGLVSVSSLAKDIDAPIKFLEQVFTELKKGGFIESRRGKVGGYQLAKPPEKITIGQVIRFIDGPIEPIACTDDCYVKCHHTRSCAFRHVWKKIHLSTSNIVDNITFADLAKQTDNNETTLTYAI